MTDFFENKCDVVRDLLPLYADHLASPETNALIMAHIAKCKNCGDFLRYIINCKERTREEKRILLEPDYGSLVRRLKKRRNVEFAVLGCSLVISVLACCTAVKLTEGSLKND